MKLGKVIGSIVASRKEENLSSMKILVVNYLDVNMHLTGKTAACIDSVGAGEGDLVLLCSSSSARLTDITKKSCSDNTIVGIVDSISMVNQAEK